MVFTTHVCSFTQLCGNNHTYVEIAHWQVLGFYHTCVVKHTHRLISPWANGAEWSKTEPEGESEEADEHDEEQSLSTDRDNDIHLLL